MISDESKYPVIYLKAAEMLFLEAPATVLTVLGSCLSVTMLHRQSGLCAICHGLLPERRGGCTECGGECRDEARYVKCSIRKMIKRFAREGVRPGDIEVKVFGGADMFGALRSGRSCLSVGSMNIEAARKTIEQAGLNVASSDVGGTEGRKLYFNTQTGEVLLKRVQPNVTLSGGNRDTK
jgi:chemotaxis protein CheD